jgi:hypothetical protein
MPTLEPILIPEGAKKRARRKKKSKGPAVVFHDAKAESPVPDAVMDPKYELISQLYEERLRNHRSIVDSMQELVDCARGSALILRSLFEYGDQLGKHNTITEGLARALKIVADNADATTFGSNSGELCDSVRPNKLVELLEIRIAELREKVNSAKQMSPKDEPKNTPEAS